MYYKQPKKTDVYEKHFKNFSNPDYLVNLFTNGTQFNFWHFGKNFRAHPASLELYMDYLVQYLPGDNKREILTERLYGNSLEIHNKFLMYIKPETKILDLGAGIGLLKDLLDKNNINVEYHAHDISKKILNLNPAEEENKYCCDFSDIKELIGDNKFDSVIDSKATHMRAYKKSDYAQIINNLTKLGKEYLFYSERYLDKKYKNFHDLSTWPNIIIIK